MVSRATRLTSRLMGSSFLPRRRGSPSPGPDAGREGGTGSLAAQRRCHRCLPPAAAAGPVPASAGARLLTPSLGPYPHPLGDGTQRSHSSRGTVGWRRTEALGRTLHARAESAARLQVAGPWWARNRAGYARPSTIASLPTRPRAGRHRPAQPRPRPGPQSPTRSPLQPRPRSRCPSRTRSANLCVSSSPLLRSTHLSDVAPSSSHCSAPTPSKGEHNHAARALAGFCAATRRLPKTSP